MQGEVVNRFMETALTTTLIVLAHPEPASFNGAWADATAAACKALGQKVLRSNLVEMGFDPVERAHHYPSAISGTPFDALKAQEAATAQNQLPADVASEIEKLQQADIVIFHFPIWWFAPPAILKGWFDRVLAHGALHTVDRRFDTGQFAGKKALFCVTTGSVAAESAPNGKEGDIQLLLWPTAYTLRYLGMTVLAPEIVHGVHGYHKAEMHQALKARLVATLDRQFDLVAGLPQRAQIQFNADRDFDENGSLKDDRPSYSAFIRHQG